jgi:exopolysaccharide biosynthesis polyprenyl glycosylphosphotransferase
MKEFPHVVKSMKPDRVVVALSERRGRMPTADLLRLRLSGVFIQEVAELYELAFDRVCLPELRPSQLIFAKQPGPRRGLVVLQSFYSLVIAAVSLVLSLPLTIVVACLVKLTSPGPILYRQVRVGRNGIPFTLYKFRSMYVDAEARSGAIWAIRDDPRITPVGRWLRLFRLDEIPQLVNVLRGEMAFVGPRPERPEFVETLIEQIPFYRQRFAIKPGITGWAQINHKYGDTIEDAITKLEYDLYYVKNISPALDFYVMFQTIKVILLARGAQ